MWASLLITMIIITGVESSWLEGLNLMDTDRQCRILVLGTSLTAGAGVAEKASYPYHLKELLSDEFDVELQIIAKPGAGLSDGRKMLLNTRIREPVHLALVELGINDVFRRLPIQEISNNLGDVVELVRKSSAYTDLMLVYVPAPLDKLDEYRSAYGEVFVRLADSHKRIFLPDAFAGVRRNREWLLPDMIHINERGHERVAGNIYRGVKRILEESGCGS